MKEITLSIIIPNYNSGDLLELTLGSIFSVESSFSFEVLIMDNISSDNPSQYVDNYPKENLNFFSETDLGIYDAMNKGVKRAKGNWLIFLGSGDELIIESLEYIFSQGLGNFKLLYGNTLLCRFNLLYDGNFSKHKLLKKNISHQAILYHRSLFDTFGFFCLKYTTWADYYFNLFVFFKDKKVIRYFDVVISKYRGGGISDIKEDFLFNSDKNKIFLKLLFYNMSFENLSIFSIYYLRRLKNSFFK